MSKPYVCQHCNYETHIKTHYNKHLNTKKHKRLAESNGVNADNITLMNNNEHQMSQNEHKTNKSYICEHCNQSYASKPSLRRHQLHYCPFNMDQNKLYHIIKTQKKEIDDFKKTLGKLQKEHQRELSKKTEEFFKEKDKLHNIISILIDKVGDKVNNITNHINVSNLDKNTNINEQFANLNDINTYQELLES